MIYVHRIINAAIIRLHNVYVCLIPGYKKKYNIKVNRQQPILQPKLNVEL